MGVSRFLSVAAVTLTLAGFALGSEPFRFVSAPDLVNADLEYQAPRAYTLDENDPDYLAKRQAIVGPRLHGDPSKVDPNHRDDTNNDYVLSLQEGYRGGMEYMLQSIAAENPSFLAVSGDLVEGEWNNRWNSFTVEQRKARIREQADIYYGAWYDNLRDAGYAGPVYTIVGDHEIGDDVWPKWKDPLVGTYLEKYIQHTQMPVTVAGDGAYVDAPAHYEGRVWAQKQRNTLLVGIETFNVLHDANGNVIGADYDSPDDKTYEFQQAQLDWLETTLTQASNDPTIEHIMVMGHAPFDVTGVRAQSSSRIKIQDGADSALWQLFEEHDVGLYLAGEVHAVSGYKEGGVTQIVTSGNPFNVGHTDYLVVEVHDDWIKLILKNVDSTLVGPRGTKFDPENNQDKSQGQEWRVHVDDEYEVVGTMAIYTGYDMPYIVEATGQLNQYMVDMDGVPDGMTFPAIPVDIPEPASAVLLALGALALRRRRG